MASFLGDAEVVERKSLVAEVRRADGQQPRLLVYLRDVAALADVGQLMTTAHLHLQPLLEDIVKNHLEAEDSIPVVVLVPSSPSKNLVNMVGAGVTSAVMSFACAHLRSRVDVVAIKYDVDSEDISSLMRTIRFVQDTPRMATVLHGALLELRAPKVPEAPAAGAKVYSLVTGGARGIGEFISRGLAQQGRNIIVTARPGGSLGNAFAAQLRETYGVDALFLPLDLSDHSSIQELSRAMVERGIVLDVVVHNAAVGTKTASHQVTETRDLSDVLIHVNSVGPVVLQQALMDAEGLLRSADEGGCAVVAISSVGALRAFAEMHPIDLVSKAIISTWAEQLDLQCRALNVMVLAPGATDTDMLQQSVLNALKQGGKLAAFTDLLPKHMLIRPEDIGAVAAFLCEPAIARHLHGAMVAACCGLQLDFNGLPHVD